MQRAGCSCSGAWRTSRRPGRWLHRSLPLSVDNRRVLVMEWVAEGFTHIFVGLLVILITALEGPFAAGSAVVYRAAAAFLALLVVWTAVTGARTPVIWYRICLVVLTAAAALLVAASLV